MLYEDAVEYVHSLEMFGWKPGLARFSALCERLGNPQDRIATVHILSLIHI